MKRPGPSGTTTWDSAKGRNQIAAGSRLKRCQPVQQCATIIVTAATKSPIVLVGVTTNWKSVPLMGRPSASKVCATTVAAAPKVASPSPILADGQRGSS